MAARSPERSIGLGTPINAQIGRPYIASEQSCHSASLFATSFNAAHRDIVNLNSLGEWGPTIEANQAVDVKAATLRLIRSDGAMVELNPQRTHSTRYACGSILKRASLASQHNTTVELD